MTEQDRRDPFCLVWSSDGSIGAKEFPSYDYAVQAALQLGDHARFHITHDGLTLAEKGDN